MQTEYPNMKNKIIIKPRQMGNSELMGSFIVNELKQKMFHEKGSEITPEMMEFAKTKIDKNTIKQGDAIELTWGIEQNRLKNGSK